MSTTISSSNPSCISPIVNIAAYKFVEFTDLEARRAEYKKLCRNLELKGTILLSQEGLNCFVAGSRESIDSFLASLRSDALLRDLEVKESLSESQPFHRMLVKIKREIISFGIESIEPAKRTSPKLSAQELKRWLDEGREVMLLDTRNGYEVQLGTFRGAKDFQISHFREFPEAVKQLPEEAKQRPLVMFCTGGIRCEKAGPLMESLGYQQVYQLEGGILKYFEECGDAHYDGACFVFDQRVALDPKLQPTGAVQCFACQATLGPDELQSPQFVFGISCPFCFKSKEQKRADLLVQRKAELVRLTTPLPGSEPYVNERVIHVPGKYAGMTLGDFLAQWYPPYSREEWQAIIDKNRIVKDSRPLTSEHIVREGERLVHIVPDTTEPDVNNQVDFVYEDEALVVVNKPAPLPSHPSGRFNRNSLSSFLAPIYRPQRLRLAHRLDANTTGLVLFGRTFAVASKLQPQFESGNIGKWYLAKVQGIPTWDETRCDAPITTEPGEIGARTIAKNEASEGNAVENLPDAAEASTSFRVLRRNDDGTCLLEVRPWTGRTNQIRVHLWHLGFPIVGDPLYLANGELGGQQTLDVEQSPMCLHAWRLKLNHPLTGEPLELEAPAPKWSLS